MSKDTQKDPETKDQETPKDPGNWEKRYKDAQAEITRAHQELSEIRKERESLTAEREAMKRQQEELIAYYQGYTTPEDDEGYIDKKEFKRWQQEHDRKLQVMQTTNEFRMKYPELREYEDLVGAFLANKTDKRKSMRDRLESAVDATKKFLDAERAKGKEQQEKDSKEKEEKEAEASGLEPKKTVEYDKDTPGESYGDYIKRRKQKALKLAGN